MGQVWEEYLQAVNLQPVLIKQCHSEGEARRIYEALLRLHPYKQTKYYTSV